MAATYDQQYQELREALMDGKMKAPPDSPYKYVWNQLTTIGKLVFKEDTVIIPDAPDQPGPQISAPKSWILRMKDTQGSLQ